jgi:hypothetical protein
MNDNPDADGFFLGWTLDSGVTGNQRILWNHNWFYGTSALVAATSLLVFVTFWMAYKQITLLRQHPHEAHANLCLQNHLTFTGRFSGRTMRIRRKAPSTSRHPAFCRSFKELVSVRFHDYIGLRRGCAADIRARLWSCKREASFCRDSTLAKAGTPSTGRHCGLSTFDPMVYSRSITEGMCRSQGVEMHQMNPWFGTAIRGLTFTSE